MATLEFKPPQTPKPEPEINLLMPKGFEPGLWASLRQNFKDTFFPAKLPPLVLTSKPVPVKDIWGFYSYKKSGATLSTIAHIIVLTAILAAPGEAANQFHGIIADANWFADFIYEYITRSERWASPKFLIGESYGTTRSAELAGVLQERHQIYLSGIVLLSSVAFSNWGADNRFEFFLPTYVTTAWYHQLLQPDLQKLTIEEVAQQAREFAHTEYAQALEKGDALSAAERQKVVADLARFTGLTPKYIEETNLRISPFRWFKELERDKRRTVGRLDSRFEGMDVDAAGERPEYDPSEASYEGAFVATFHDYVRRELKWDSDAYYTVTANVRPWDQTGNTEVAEVLRAAMTQQTYLKVLVLCGYYDVATPFNGIENTVAHMNLEPSVRKNVSFAYYEAGHMMYIDEKEHHKLHKDVDEFINAGYGR